MLIGVSFLGILWITMFQIRAGSASSVWGPGTPGKIGAPAGSAELAMARSMFGRGEIEGAILKYAAAARLNPAYLDKGGEKYLGDEFLKVIEKGKGTGGREQREALRFLVRRMKGGCT